MSDVKANDGELNQMILEGKGFPDGFNKFYADNVVMIEGDGTKFEGKETNFEREKKFFESVEAFHGATLVSSAVGDDVSFSEWIFDVTMKGAPRHQMQEIARREWKDGKIVNERFYYNVVG